VPPAENGLSVWHEPKSDTNQIRMVLQLKNTLKTNTDLSQLKLRYWFTKEGAGAPALQCYWAAPEVGGCSALDKAVTFGTTTATDASNYLELGFAGTLGAETNTGNLDITIRVGNWETQTASNDYSHAASTGINDKIALYYAGKLVWGDPPGDEPGAGGAGGAGGAPAP
jgi:hypothetical protein